MGLMLERLRGRLPDAKGIYLHAGGCSPARGQRTLIETGRLRLRAWREEDAAALGAIRADERVIATLGPSKGDAAGVIERQNACLAANGFCLWALAVPSVWALMSRSE